MKGNIFIWQRRDKGVWLLRVQHHHYNDVMMSAMASQITSLTIVYLTICSGADQRKHISASLAFAMGFTGDRWIPRTNGQWRGKCFHFMTSSWLLPPVYMLQGHILIPEFDTNCCYGSMIYSLIKHISRSTYDIRDYSAQSFIFS